MTKHHRRVQSWSALNTRGRISARKWYRQQRSSFGVEESREMVMMLVHGAMMGTYFTDQEEGAQMTDYLCCWQTGALSDPVFCKSPAVAVVDDQEGEFGQGFRVCRDHLADFILDPAQPVPGFKVTVTV